MENGAAEMGGWCVIKMGNGGAKIRDGVAQIREGGGVC